MNSRSGADQTTEVDHQYSFVETGSSHPLPPSTDDRYENGERAYKINGRTTALAEYLPADTTTQTAVVPWKLPLKARRVEGPKWVDRRPLGERHKPSPGPFHTADVSWIPEPQTTKLDATELAWAGSFIKASRLRATDHAIPAKRCSR